MKFVSCLIMLVLAASSFAASPTVIQQSAQSIDAELNKQSIAAKVPMQPLINDDKFVRRAYLTIVGRIPTYAEYEQFSKISNPAKRTELVKYLVNTKGFASNIFNFWADSLRLRDRINNVNFFNGRDHFPKAFSQVLIGAGIKGGTVYGSTNEKGAEVTDGQVTVQDFNATIAAAIGLSTEQKLISPEGRPFTVADKGKPIIQVLA